MKIKLLLSLSILGFAFQTNLTAQNAGNEGTQNITFEGTFTQTGSMDLDRTTGDLSYSLFEATVARSRPLNMLGGVTVIPSFTYRLTQIDFDQTAPLGDEDLHSAAAQAFFIKDFEQSRWQAFGWTRAELASDFQGIESEDFTFDVAAGAGYRFNDELLIGFGLVALNLNGDDQVFPGIYVNWSPSENFNINLFGPNFRAKYTLSEDWNLSLTGQPGGGEWNIDDNLGRSRTLDLDSYLVGLNTNHRLTGGLWLSAGVGYALANEVEIRGNRGGALDFGSDMDSAPFARIGLTLLNW